MNPLALPLAALVAGIWLFPYLEARTAWFCLPIAAAVAVLRPRFAILGIFLAGVAARSIANPPVPRLVDDGFPSRVVGHVSDGPHHVRGRFRMTLALDGLNGAPISGMAQVDYFPQDSELQAMFEALQLGTGDRIEILVRLRRPSVYRNPGGFDYARHLENDGVYWTGTLRNPRLVRVLDRGSHFPSAWRQRMEDRITDQLSGGAVVRALALGMVLGRRDGMPPAAARRFEHAGLTHLVVVSGFNLAVVAFAALWTARRLPLGRHRRLLRLTIALAVVIAYMLLVDGDAPVARATVMSALLIAGTALDRGYRILTALTTSAFVILLFDPMALEDSGFLMTSIAVLAIDRLALPAIRWFREAAGRSPSTFLHTADSQLDPRLGVAASDWRVIRRLRAERSGLPLWVFTVPSRLRWGAFDILLVTLAVQLALLGLTVESYHRVSLVALPLNVVGAVAASIVTPLGLAVALIPSPVGWLPGLVIDYALRALIGAVDLAVAWPDAVKRVPSPPSRIWTAFFLSLVWLALAIGVRRPRSAVLAFATTGVLAAVVAVADFSPPPPRAPTLTFLDVGQGDAIMVELTDGRRFLIDGGGTYARSDPEAPDDEAPGGGFSIGEDVVVAYLLSQGIRHLDAIVLSHAHQDHMGGLIDVAAAVDVGELWLGPNPVVPGFVRLLETASVNGIPIRWLAAGDVLPPFTVLHPPPGYIVGPTVRNDDSLVIRLDTRVGSALFPGDLESDLSGDAGPISVLKVPHHGSRNGARNLGGRLRVISVGGQNPFGHPHPSRLPALRTDILGAIRVEMTPDGPWVTFPGL